MTRRRRERLLDATLGRRWQARLDELRDVVPCPGWGLGSVAFCGGAAYGRHGQRAELAALAVAGHVRGRGIGGVLLETVASTVAGQGANEREEAARWTWPEFRALPAEDVTVDIPTSMAPGTRA